MRRLSHAAGLTLIELLVGLALTAMVLVAMTSMLQVSSASSAASAEQLDLQEQAQFAMRRIVQRIEQTPAALLAPKSNDTSGSWLSPALYDLRGGSLSETIGGTTSVLAENATSLSITSAPVNLGHPVVTVAFTLNKLNASARIVATASVAVSVRLGAAL